MATWEVNALPTGTYLLRVVATTFSGEQFQEIIPVPLELPVRQITIYPGGQWNPAISKDRIVWEDDRNGNRDIYLYDLATGREQPLTTDRAGQHEPAISDDRIVWEDDRNGNGDIYLYDLATGREWPITTHPAMQREPAISDGVVVWRDNRNGNWDIYSCLYDPATGRCPEQAITTDPSDQLSPAISVGRIIWMDNRNVGWHVYLYDLATNMEWQITSHPAERMVPDISGDRIVWQDNRNGNWDIFMSELPDGRPMTPTLVLTAQPARVSEGQQSVLSWASAHADQCQASGGWSGVKAVRGTEAVSPTTTTRYSLTCTGSVGSASQAATVSVFTVSASPVTVRPGESLTIEWTAPPGRPAADLLGVNVAGSPPASPLLSQSTGGAPTGRLSYTLPPGTQPGRYVVRYFLDGSLEVAAQSQPVTVLGTPAPPTLLAPIHKTTLPATTSSTILSWNPVPGATWYAVRANDTTDPSRRDPRNTCAGNPHYLCLDVSATTITLPVHAGHSYTWWVHAIDAAGQVSDPATATFTIHQPRERAGRHGGGDHLGDDR
ncbi:MAG: hypothetical protein HYY90_02840 [Candidatus Omnitrophica bacterium]|nr:hypothetical protein [Candidatus Omnitrophota bacterium]